MHAALPYETPYRRRRSYVRRALRWGEAHYVPHAAFVVVLVFGILHYRAFRDANWYAFAYAKSAPVKPVAPVTFVAIAPPPPVKSPWMSGGTTEECPSEARGLYQLELELVLAAERQYLAAERQYLEAQRRYSREEELWASRYSGLP